MTYAFPESLTTLRKYLKSKGFEGSSVKTSRQAAFVAQQLLGTKIKFPPQGQDMTMVLMQIQKAVPVKGIATMATPQRDLRHTGASTPQRYVHDTHTPKAKKPDQRSKKTVSHRKREALQKTFAPETFAEGVHIFCDGCCEPNPGEGGWGVAVFRDGIEIDHAFGGHAEATNNVMELTGILNAIEKAAQLAFSTGRTSSDSEKVTIWCDSQYVVKGCNEWRHGWKAKGWQRGGDNAEPKNRVLANADLWKSIDEALSSSESELAIKWVKGHAGVAGNERADELAEMGRQEASEKVGKLFPLCDDLDERYRQIMGAA